MTYIHNPKTEGSGIICCIPQTGRCPNGCSDCFFQSGRSYLEPLDKNLPNIPSLEEAAGKIVRVNDGNDSNIKRDIVIENTKQFPNKFYNTAIPMYLEEFDAPIVLTLNPGKMTDTMFHKLDSIPKNLMMVRIRTNTWNIDMVDDAVEYYTSKDIPVVLTMMAYYNDNAIPEGESKIECTRKTCRDHKEHYIYRKRTLNSYYAITTAAWMAIMDRYRLNKFVSSCGKIEGELGKTGCRYCGNCLREYFATVERMKND